MATPLSYRLSEKVSLPMLAWLKGPEMNVFVVACFLLNLSQVLARYLICVDTKVIRIVAPSTLEIRNQGLLARRQIMIVTCGKCEQKYKIDTSKLNKGILTTVECTACGSSLNIKPAEDMKKTAATSKSSKRRVFGLKGKIFALFFVVPIALIITAGYLFVHQLNSMSMTTSAESSTMVTQMAEEIIYNKAVAVAREVKQYLDTHPNLKKEDFNKTPEFKNIAMQKVGKTGYTLLVERKTKENPKEIMWVHPVDKLVGIDMEPALKKKLGDKWESWAKIRSKDHITKGYYLWFDNREKYCANIPLSGTRFNIVSSTYIDEFTQPVKELQAKMGAITDSTIKIVITIICFTVFLVASIAILYGNRLTSKISRLTKVADRISLGDMSAHLADADKGSKDELGDLAQSITRMQSSIGLAMERLRNSRSRPKAA
jgi:HAMP domain-containing protein